MLDTFKLPNLPAQFRQYKISLQYLLAKFTCHCDKLKEFVECDAKTCFPVLFSLHLV